MTADKEIAEQLIDQCRAWCALLGHEPSRQSEVIGNWFLRRAVNDYVGSFETLNDHQRRMIAGVGL